MTSENIKILIADDHKIFRDGVRALLQYEEGLEVVAEACDGNETIEKLNEVDVDVILMDIEMPKKNGIETTHYVCEHFPKTNVLSLSMYDQENYIMEMLRAGALGYILKNTGRTELVNAIKTIAVGDSYFSKEVSGKLFSQLSRRRQSRVNEVSGESIPLTEREKDVLKLIATEFTNQEIAEKLSISIRTVDTHRRNLLQKLQVKNTAGLVRYAFQIGLVE